MDATRLGDHLHVPIKLKASRPPGAPGENELVTSGASNPDGPLFNLYATIRIQKTRGFLFRLALDQDYMMHAYITY